MHSCEGGIQKYLAKIIFSKVTVTMDILKNALKIFQFVSNFVSYIFQYQKNQNLHVPTGVTGIYIKTQLRFEGNPCGTIGLREYQIPFRLHLIFQTLKYCI